MVHLPQKKRKHIEVKQKNNSSLYRKVAKDMKFSLLKLLASRISARQKVL